MRRDIVERCIESCGGQHLVFARTDHLAAKAEPAIDRTNMRKLQENAVIIAMNDSWNRTVPLIANGIAALIGHGLAFPFRRHKLARDRIARIMAIDKIGDSGRDRHGVTRSDGAQRFRALRCDEAGHRQVLRSPQNRGLAHRASHSGAGVHMTRSIRPAPVASITKRSKPSATPDASGIVASA